MISRRRCAQLLLVLGVSAMASGCRRDSHNSLTLAGSTSLQPLAERWADAYSHKHPESRLTIQGGGSTAGIRAALSGAAQIGMVSRSLTAQESRRARSVNVARDGIALVVHPENSVKSLTLFQIQQLYAGEIKSWRGVGGMNRDVTVITREEGSGTRAAFESLAMGDRAIVASALVSDSTGAVSQMVGSDPAAIGYISIGLVGPGVRALSIDGIKASEESIDAGRYPLVRPFLFVLRIGSEHDQRATDFMRWVTGPEGREVTRREGMLPPRDEEPHAAR
jgi:phosphate transport system substrate-binding protein